MAGDNSSEFGPQFVAVSQESVEAQFIAENICGEGAGCVVYRVRLDGLLVAVKRLSDRHRLNAAFIAAYRKEFEIGRRLRHMALPVYRELRADARDVYIVMDFIDGATLDDFLDTSRGKDYFRDDENLRNFLSRTLDVLAYLHRSGVVHCDLKPANLMLRHSDCSVILIDFDKAYCDTHDLTHGGTPGMSDAVTGQSKPMATKDFAALGRVMDVLLSRDNRSVPRRFRRFRKLCDQPGITADKLKNALEASAKKTTNIVVTVAALIVSVMAVYGLFFQERNALPDSREGAKEYNNVAQTAPDTAETVITPDKAVTAPDEIVNAPETGSSVVGRDNRVDNIDFDGRMERYVKETVSARAALRSGKLTDTEIQDMTQRTSDLYLQTYERIIEDYRKMHPTASETDVYRDVIAAAGSSRAFKIMQSFSKELVDTINSRLKKLD